MIPFGRKPIRIGVDAGEDAFRLVAIQGQAVVMAIEVPVVEGEITRVDAARRAFATAERRGVVGVQNCVAVAPTTAMTTAILELPPRSSGAPVEALAASEMVRGADGSGLEVALFPIRVHEAGSVEYFVAGAWRDKIEALINDLGCCGIEIDAVDAPTCALGRACAAHNCMIVSVGSVGIEFHVIHGGKPILSRSVALTGGPPLGETLIAEIDRCAGYLSTYRAESAIDEIVLVGSGADATDVVSRVEFEFDVKVRVWTPALVVSARDTDLGEDAVRPAYAAAYGAATWHHAGRAAA